MGQKQSRNQIFTNQTVEIGEDVAKSFENNESYSYPFLCDEDTISHMKHSRTVIILRGLPGSGKTYLANKLKQTYPAWCLEVCSADEYFERDRTYQFDKTKLSDAHQYCRNKSLDLCKNGKHIIVIDNTNVTLSEMVFYMDLAKRCGYVQLFVEPMTSWKFDLDVLTLRNVHQVEREIIDRRLSQWETMKPVYFAWFINPCDSVNLYDLSSYYLECCMKVPKFEEEFRNHIATTRTADIVDYFGFNGKKPQILHCTSKYCGTDGRGAEEYWERVWKERAYGKSFTLEIIGFVVTQKTFGARVKLNIKELQLWDQDDNEISPEVPLENAASVLHPQKHLSKRPEFHDPKMSRGSRGRGHGRGGYSPRSASVKTAHPNNFQPIDYYFGDIVPPDALLCQPTLRSSPRKAQRKDNFFHPTEGFGSRAHITIRCCYGISPVQTGHDMVEAIKLESIAWYQKLAVVSYNIPGAIIRKYKQDVWMLYLEKPLLVNSIFAFYAASKPNQC